MKNKIKSMLLACTMTVSCLPFSWTSANAATPDYSLWDKFIKYDLCITDYDSLTNEEKDLCHFIFVTEQSSDKPIRCERARRILAHDGNIGERITLEQLDAAYGICDRYSGTKKGMYMKNISYSYTHCVADIIGLDGWYGYNEYWLDDKGSVKVTEYYNEDKFNITSSLTNEETEKFFSEHSSIIHDTTGEAYINKKSIDTIKYIKYEDNTYYITYDNKAILYKNHYYDYNDKYKDAEAITEPCIIPSEVNGYPVIGIDSRAFYGSVYVEIVLPDTIELIGSNAFGYCKQLKKINFPNKLKCIEVDAFKNCAFEDLSINAPDLNIQPYAFECCKDLTQIKLNVKTVGENAFFDCASLEDAVIGDDTENINAEAFMKCTSLDKINIPASLKAIGTDAFTNTLINLVTIPPTVEIIGSLPAQRGEAPTSGVHIPETHPLTDLPKCSFDSDCTINGWYGTEAHSYAIEWGLKFNPLDENIAYGDLNADNSIDIADAVLMYSYISGHEVTVGFEADLTKDGIIDAFDMAAMRRNLIAILHTFT